jgi:hypothetical protein
MPVLMLFTVFVMFMASMLFTASMVPAALMAQPGGRPAFSVAALELIGKSSAKHSMCLLVSVYQILVIRYNTIYRFHD